MNKPIRFKTSVAYVHASGTAAIERMLFDLMPEAVFSMLTYEGDDFAMGNLTYFLYDEVPERLRVTIPLGYSLQEAIEQLQELNPHVRLVASGYSFKNRNLQDKTEFIQLLRILSNDMFVTTNGLLLQ